MGEFFVRLQAFISGLTLLIYTYMSHDQCHVTQAGEGQKASCHQPLSVISDHKQNTEHWCSMKGLGIPEHEENCFQQIKEAINIH